MPKYSQSPRDRILWILASNGGKMERSRLRAKVAMRYALLNPIIDELVREGKIKITVGKHGELISLKELIRQKSMAWCNWDAFGQR